MNLLKKIFLFKCQSCCKISDFSETPVHIFHFYRECFHSVVVNLSDLTDITSRAVLVKPHPSCNLILNATLQRIYSLMRHKYLLDYSNNPEQIPLYSSSVFCQFIKFTGLGFCRIRTRSRYLQILGALYVFNA